MEETEPVIMTATCHTEGCEAPPYTGPMYPPFNVLCYQCGQRITDVVPAAA
ncbi:hypothetical protein [Streptomyces sp. SID7909]|uniref:hypothetical protein n=1 Tax=Streptomyces sp. SID7909 TaxID=2706092 RepID=UPI0013BBDC71|nr:hypothetical protein [Streptomyces sp. SID7909]NEC07933.1 hypothetical protein [Streptomyces sp. SID7909]